MPTGSDFDDIFNKSNTGPMFQMKKSEEQRFLKAMRQIFKESDLLKGKVPNDKILVQNLSPALVKNLKEMAKLDPTPIKEMKAAINKEISPKKPRKK